MKLWDQHGRTDDMISRFTVGDDPGFDCELAEYDVIGSIAHAQMLSEVGLLSENDWRAVDAGLRRILTDIREGRFEIEDGVEDVHSQVELLLTADVGDAGKRIHTARSRNDQVLLDLKLYFRDAIRAIADGSASFARALLDRSDRHAEVPLPGYTHGQAAMPSSFGQWFAAHAESLAEDLLPLHGAYRMADRNPLGSAAGFGTSFPIDRDRTTDLLGFESLHVNAVNAQMSRGKTERVVAQAFAAVAASIGRFAADVCMYVSGNYGFLRMREEITTGSSIMPHKKNPDVFELLRAHCNRLQALPGDITLMTANLPSGYHRDFQLLKELLVPAVKRLQACLEIAIQALEYLEVNERIFEDGAYDVVFSVDAIRQRVDTGMPFRDAYRDVAAALREGRFTPPSGMRATHLGSPGNLGNDRIRAWLEAEFRRFDFSRRDAAFAALLDSSGGSAIS